MTDVFLSYASEDRVRVRPLVDLLERQGWTVWWDREIHAGPRFDQVIEKALDQASCVVVVWSRQSVQSDWVQTEASEGLERDILVPVRIDDVRLPLGFRRSRGADSFSITLFQAALADLEGDEQEVLRLVKGREPGENVESSWPEYLYARAVGDTDRALTYYERAVDRREPPALVRIHGSVLDRRVMPDMYEHPRYKSLLREMGLDREALKEIRVPPFPSALSQTS